MLETILPGLYRLPVSLPNKRLGSVNTYVVACTDGIRLIDCAWNLPEAYTTLVEGLRELDAQVSDLREILLTHSHPDHIGQAERLVHEAGARVLIHRLDATYFGWTAADMQALGIQWRQRLQVMGMPSDELETLFGASSRSGMQFPTCKPDTLLEGGEVLEWTPFRFKVIWTPGHAAGLICLYEAQSEVLLSSDHVLQRISPHIGMGSQHDGDPLADYLRSLQAVRALPAKIVLPGHGKPFTNLSERVDELIEHHHSRLQTIIKALAGDEQTAYAVASRLSWRGSENGWQRLPVFERMSAADETLAHLEYLTNLGQIKKQTRDAVVVYRTIEME